MIEIRPGLRIDPKSIRAIRHDHAGVAMFEDHHGQWVSNRILVECEVGRANFQYSLYFNDQAEAIAMVERLDKESGR